PNARLSTRKNWSSSSAATARSGYGASPIPRVLPHPRCRGRLDLLGPASVVGRRVVNWLVRDDRHDRDDRDETDLRRRLEHAERITVLTGAGISTDSGIPDYRGPNGLWTRNPEAARMSTLQDYIADPEVRRRAWRSRQTHPAWTAEPNAGHRALVDLERSGRLVALLTQNID